LGPSWVQGEGAISGPFFRNIALNSAEFVVGQPSSVQNCL